MCVEKSCETCLLEKEKVPLSCDKCKTPVSSKATKSLTRQVGSSDVRRSFSPLPTTSLQDRKPRLDSTDTGYDSSEDRAKNILLKRLLTRKSHSTSEIEGKGAHLEVNYRLKTLEPCCSSVYRRISSEVLLEQIKAMGGKFFDDYTLVDCRYKYEFDGGHIKGAQNFYKPDFVKDLFFTTENAPIHNKVPIFYCEYSQKRGPAMADALRSIDRLLNSDAYPNCAFEEIYVLNGGYKQFYEHVNGLRMSDRFCEPNGYITMIDPMFCQDLARFSEHKKTVRKIKFSRSTTSILTTSVSGSRFLKTSMISKLSLISKENIDPRS